MGKRNRPKKKSQFAHACRRAKERFGLHFTENDVHEIRRMIERGEAKHVYRQSHRVTHWQIEYRGIEAIIVYDKLRKMVVTFLEIEKYDFNKNNFNFENA